MSQQSANKQEVTSAWIRTDKCGRTVRTKKGNSFSSVRFMLGAVLCGLWPDYSFNFAGKIWSMHSLQIPKTHFRDLLKCDFVKFFICVFWMISELFYEMAIWEKWILWLFLLIQLRGCCLCRMRSGALCHVLSIQCEPIVHSWNLTFLIWGRRLTCLCFSLTFHIVSVFVFYFISQVHFSCTICVDCLQGTGRSGGLL